MDPTALHVDRLPIGVLNNLPIASPRTFRFLGGYLRIGMPRACWRTWRSWDVLIGSVRTHYFCAGPFFAWVRVEQGGQLP